jgi:hypothetical protein
MWTLRRRCDAPLQALVNRPLPGSVDRWVTSPEKGGIRALDDSHMTRPQDCPVKVARNASQQIVSKPSGYEASHRPGDRYGGNALIFAEWCGFVRGRRFP